MSYRLRRLDFFSAAGEDFLNKMIEDSQIKIRRTNHLGERDRDRTAKNTIFTVEPTKR